MKFFVLLGLVTLSSTGSFGQLKNIKLDEQNENDDMGAPAVAINSKNPLNIVAAATSNSVYVTTDGGASWEKQKLSSSNVPGDVAIIADGSTFYYFHSANPAHAKNPQNTERIDRIMVQRSGDGGSTWDEVVSIGIDQSKGQSKPRPTIDSKGNLTVTWTQFDSYGSNDPHCQSAIMMSTSRNGSKWSDPIVVSQIPGSCLDNDSTARGAMPAVTFDSKAFVAWAANQKIYLDRSFDGNLWLSNDIPVLDQRGGWDLTIPGHMRANGLPVFMTDRSKTGTRGYLFLTWADQRNGENDTDVWFSRSTNYGDNWSTPLNLSMESKNHQYMPWMTVDQSTGFIYVLFYDRSAHRDLQTDVVMAWSTDGGNTFKNTRISEVPFLPDGNASVGDNINISAHKGTIAAVWTRIDDGKTSIWASVFKHADLEASSTKK